MIMKRNFYFFKIGYKTTHKIMSKILNGDKKKLF